MEVRVIRIWIISAYFTTGLLLLGLRASDVIPGPLLAVFGVAATMCALASPAFVVGSLLSLRTSASTVNIGYCLLALFYFAAVARTIYKAWPALMGV